MRHPKTNARDRAYEFYAEVVERVRAKSGMITDFTTGPGGQLIVGPANAPRMFNR